MLAKMDVLVTKSTFGDKPSFGGLAVGPSHPFFGVTFGKYKFSTGDRVITVRNVDGKETKDLHGTVAAVLRHGTDHGYIVRYDNYMGGHDGGFMNGNFGYYWCVKEEDLIKEAKQPERNIMSELSTLAKRTFDADTKALVKVGLLNNSLTLRDADLLLDMLVTVFKKELVSEAKKRIAEQESESK